MRILLVDDSSTMRKMIRRQLATGCREEVDIVEASDGQDVIAKIVACNGSVDLVFCDVNMPRVHGLSFVKSMRGSPRLRDIPVILVTADNSDETAKQALREGAAGLITKPFAASVMCDIVTRIGRRGRRSMSSVYKTEMVSKMARLFASTKKKPG